MHNDHENIITGRQKLMREINRNLLIKMVVRHGTIGRSEMAKQTGLSLPSVMRITEQLIEEGLLKEEGKGASSGGRKPSLLTLKSDAFYIIGVDIALHTTVVLADLSGGIIERWESHAAGQNTAEDMLEKINEEIGRLLTTHEIPWERFAGIGIGTPGTNFKYAKEMELSIMKGWEDLDVKAWFEARRMHPDYRILTENVARTRALNELWFGQGRDHKNFLYVFVDRGVGCGFISHEMIYQGQDGVAGEFGHTVVYPGGKPCYCGSSGCIEMYISAGAITRQVRERCRITDPDFGFDEAVALADQPAVREVFEESGRILGYGVANLINLCNPKIVILGGKVPVASPLLAEAAQKTARDNIFSRSALETLITVSTIDSSADCLGSVALVINDMFRSVEI